MVVINLTGCLRDISFSARWNIFHSMSISYNCLYEISWNETLYRCFFIGVISTEMQLHFGWWSVNTKTKSPRNHREIKSLKWNQNKNDNRIVHIIFVVVAVLQIRAGQRSITANLRPLIAHIYYIMIIVTGGFSNKSFLLFSRNSFEWSWTCFLEI